MKLSPSSTCCEAHSWFTFAWCSITCCLLVSRCGAVSTHLASPTFHLCRLCNKRIIAEVQQLICFAFHDSRLLLETAGEAKEAKKIVTLFYLD
jgi:hypothetical protein